MEEKIILDVKKDIGLYLFKRPNRVEYVVAYINGDCKVGDYVESWISGHYFSDLKSATKYFRERVRES